MDIILELRGQVLPFEIKATTHIGTRDASGLISFLADHPHVKKGYIVYPGREIQQINAKVTAVPDWWLLGC